MELGNVEQSSGARAVEEPRGPSAPATVRTENEARFDAREEPPGQIAELLAKVRRLEVELERYRVHAQRTSNLFLAASNFASWVRESARRDAEVTLRKARARAEKLGALEEDCERAEQELAQLQDELERMRALTQEARARLSAFLTAGLQALDAEAEAEGAQAEPASSEGDGDLRRTLHERLGATSTSVPTLAAEPGRPDL